MANCYIAATGGAYTEERRFPLSRSGWKAARDFTFKMRDSSGVGMTALVCPGNTASRAQQPGTPLYRCDKGERGCFIEGYDGDVILAGRKRRRRRR